MTGATIQRAYIEAVSDTAPAGPANLSVFVELDNPDGAAPEDDAEFWSSVSVSAPVSWTPQGTVGETIRTPDLSAIIQDAVDEFGGSLTGVLVYVVDNFSDLNTMLSIRSFDHPTGPPPKLVVHYTPA